MPTFIEAVRSVKAHVSKDTTLPLLTAVHVTFDGEYVEASDRYTLVRARITSGPVPPAGCYSPAAVKIILAGGAPEPDLFVGEYPDLSGLIPDRDGLLPSRNVSPIGLDAAHLARFAPAHLPKSPKGFSPVVRLTPGERETSPVMVTVEHRNPSSLEVLEELDWIGLILPRRGA